MSVQRWENERLPQITIIVDPGLGNASYVVDVGDGRALVIDPGRDPRPYLQAARDQGTTIAFVAETHLHADFVSGSHELTALGAELFAPEGSQLELAHHPMMDQQVVDLGSISLRALSTPGHTPEHLSYELQEADDPIAVFTGGSLLRGSVARTDLIAPEETEPLARQLYRSITDRLFALPDHVVVFPTHGAGASFCSVSTSDAGDVASSIGRERAMNRLLQAPDEGTFARSLLATYGSYPRYFTRLRQVNREGPRLVESAQLKLPLLEPAHLRPELARGAMVIDVRPIESFARGHVRGALSIALRPAFAVWLGWLVPEGTPLIFVVDEDQDRSDLVGQCLKVGYEALVGELPAEPQGWEEAGLPVQRANLIAPAAAAAGARIVDIRQRTEYELGHVPGSLHIELGALQDSVGVLPKGPLTFQCGHGERAMSAASLLARFGRADVSVIAGGPGDVCDVRGQAPIAGQQQ